MAAADVTNKKRKGAADAAPKAKKPRKSDDVAALAKPAKSPKATKAATASVAEKPTRKSARKTAEDFFSDEEAPASPVAKPTKPSKGKKKAEPVPGTNGDEDESMLDFDVIEAKKETPKKEAPKTNAVKVKKGKKEAAAEPEVAEEPVVETTKTKATKAKKGKKAQEEPAEEIEVDAVVTEDGDVEDAAEDDDQTAALLAGFSSDDSDPEDDEDFPKDSAVVPKLTKSQKKAIAKAKDTPKATEPGVIYVGRVPRGFFEPQMKKYFNQFGRVLNLRLSRNKQTGASKHYAFVEFASAEVADIVARTMNNYLMFGHILKCALIPKEQVHENLFKGAGTRFKVDPRNKKAGLAMERGAERQVWEKRVEKEGKRRTGRNKDLKETFGYEFEAPKLSAVAAIRAGKKLEVKASEPPQLLAEAPAQTEGKKGKKTAKAAKPAPVETEAVVEETVETAPKKTTKKRKSTDAAEVLVAAVEEPAKKAAVAPKAKKAKKAKA